MEGKFFSVAHSRGLSVSDNGVFVSCLLSQRYIGFPLQTTMSQGQNFLPKFLFVSNLLKAVKIRERVPNDVVKPSASGSLIHHLRSMHRYTLEMIRMSQFPQAFREVIQAAILDRAMQCSLEQEKRLNWCREVKKLVPLRTNGNYAVI